MRKRKVTLKHSALILCCIMAFFKLPAQEGGKKITIEEKLKKYEGAFQIQVKDLRYKPNIPYNIDELIEKNRKQSETVYLTLGSAVRLKILSMDEIKTSINKKLELITTFTD